MTTTTLTTPTAAPGEVRASHLNTKRAIVAVYLRRGGVRMMIAAFGAALAVRLVVGGLDLADDAVVAVVAAIVGPFEWVVHRFLLHAPEGSWRNRWFKTGVGHRHHHLDPLDVGWLMLQPIEVGQFLPMLAAFTALWSLPALWLTGSPLLGPFLTALIVTYAGLAHYEWTHLLVHARYRPRTRYYARLARNHRLHHYRNERYWLGVTSNSGDRIFGTMPATKTDVPLSDTARTLA